MGDKDFVKPELERRGTVHFGKVPLVFACFMHGMTSITSWSTGWES